MMPADPQTTEPRTDAELLRLAERFDYARQVIQGFHYPPNRVIRDLRQPPEGQIIWREAAEHEEAYWDQLKVEYMRYALESPPQEPSDG